MRLVQRLADLRIGVGRIEDVMLDVAADLDLAERHVRDARERLRRKPDLRDHVVLELEIRIDLHELGPVGAGPRGHGSLLLLERPAPCKAHDSTLLAGRIDDECERVVELVIEVLPTLVGQAQPEMEAPIRKG